MKTGLPTASLQFSPARLAAAVSSTRVAAPRRRRAAAPPPKDGGAAAGFDTDKVLRLSRAIAEGSYRIDAEAIAERLLAEAPDLPCGRRLAPMAN